MEQIDHFHNFAAFIEAVMKVVNAGKAIQKG
jgi:hypothetical protein